MFGWMYHQPSLGAHQYAVGGSYGQRARFIFQYQLITKQPTVLGKGWESQCARSLLPRIAIKCHALAHWQKHRWGSRISHDLYLVQSPSNAKQSFDILSTSMFECLCICATRLVIFQRRTVGSPLVAFWPDPVFWPTLIDSLLAAAGANQSWKGERGVFSKSWLHFAKLERCCLRGQQI